MKKAIISFLFALSVAVSFGFTGTYKIITVPSTGLTTTIPTNIPIPDLILVVPDGGGVTLSGNVSITFSGNPPKGTVTRIVVADGFNLNGHSLIVLNSGFQQYQLETGNAWTVGYMYIDGTGGNIRYDQPITLTSGLVKALDGSIIIDGTIPFAALAGDVPISAIDTTGRGRIWYGNSTNQTSTLFAGGNGKILIGDGTDVNSVSVSGDIAITSAGVTSIAAGSIVNADVNASAAIALSKLAALTASKPVVTDGSGVLTTANQISPAFGGTGQDFSASTGFQKWSAGTASVSAITDVRDLHVSFASNSQGTYYITFPVSATVTNIEARVETALAGTDDATLEIQDNSGTDMTGNNLTAGLLTLAASATTGTGYTSTLTSNNTFTAGQRMRIISAKTTAGGTINVQVTYTRNE